MDKQLIDKHLRKISYVTLAIFITIFAFESISLSSNFQGIPPSPRKKSVTNDAFIAYINERERVRKNQISHFGCRLWHRSRRCDNSDPYAFSA